MKLDRTEMVVIGVVFVALVALLVAKYRAPATLDNSPPAEPTNDQNTGPLYLLGNLPWGYQPWIGNSIPQTTAGQAGQTADLTQYPAFGSGN